MTESLQALALSDLKVKRLNRFWRMTPFKIVVKSHDKINNLACSYLTPLLAGNCAFSAFPIQYVHPPTRIPVYCPRTSVQGPAIAIGQRPRVTLNGPTQTAWAASNNIGYTWLARCATRRAVPLISSRTSKPLWASLTGTAFGVRQSVSLSVCLSVTHCNCVDTAAHVVRVRASYRPALKFCFLDTELSG